MVSNNIEENEEDNFDFEMICPYCDNEFVINLDNDQKEIECPKCKKVISLDWSGDLEDCDCDSCDGEVEDDNYHGCSGNCHGCSGC